MSNTAGHSIYSVPNLLIEKKFPDDRRKRVVKSSFINERIIWLLHLSVVFGESSIQETFNSSSLIQSLNHLSDQIFLLILYALLLILRKAITPLRDLESKKSVDLLRYLTGHDNLRRLQVYRARNCCHWSSPLNWGIGGYQTVIFHPQWLLSNISQLRNSVLAWL